MTVLFLAFLGLLLAGVPVFAATALSAIFYIWMNGLPPLIVASFLPYECRPGRVSGSSLTPGECRWLEA